MIAIPISKVKAVMTDCATDIQAWMNTAAVRLENLHNRAITNDEERAYLANLLFDWDAIVKGEPDYLSGLKDGYELPNAIAARNTEFKDRVLAATGYTDLRRDFLPEYFRKIGIKACVYCNSQLAITVDGFRFEDGDPLASVNARFQVDHYIDKGTYPCFSVSLFNFYPVCATCNLSKSQCKINFNLYRPETECTKSLFTFILDEDTKAQYVLDRDPSILDFTFDEPDLPDNTYQDFKHTFDIEGIYRTQKDIIEELILKKETYTEEYIELLRKEFHKILKDPNIFDRLLLGNYVKPGEIHNRPLAKFTQDIAEQIGFVIPKKL
jgi:hypothetical protein